MNCNTSSHFRNCCCNDSMSQQFWSKKKKLEILNHYLECLDEKKQDIQEAIDEIKNEK